MTLRRLLLPALAGSCLVIGLIAFALSASHQAARALPPAGTDNVFVTADVTVNSRIGTETVHLTGLATISREDPHMEGGVEVVDMQITSIQLTGMSSGGQVTVMQGATPTTGEIRSLQPSPPQYPASSFFDVFVNVEVPASPGASMTLHNEVPIHVVASSDVTSWPPYGVQYDLQSGPPGTVTPSPTPTATIYGGSPACPTGIWLLPMLPSQTCVTDVSFTMSVPPTATPTITPCVPTCTPTATPTGPLPTATRTPRPTSTPTPTPGPFAPEDRAFSVGRNGPSGLHPADMLARGPSTGPIPVSGNDAFADAWEIAGLPFTGTQSTAGFTTESGEPLTTADPTCIPQGNHTKGATAWYKLTPGASGTVAVDTANSGVGYDTVLAVYTGSSVNSLTLVACDDDGLPNFRSSLSFSATAGTTYYVQAGGFQGDAGDLVLNVTGPAGAGSEAAHAAVPCPGLGLVATGCDSGSDGSQDDLDAMSFGHDFQTFPVPFTFSVAPGSAGATGSGVAAQAACSPAEPQADLFWSTRNGDNTLVVDGDGAANDCPTEATINLTERPSSDNLDAISGQGPSVVDPDGDGDLDQPVYFSLAPASPTVSSFGRGPADVLWTVGFSPGLFASAAQLGLQASDDIDGLCISHPGAGQVYNPAQDRVLFSLAPGSPTLASLGASAADVLAPGPKIAIRAWELGLATGDNVDALSCGTPAGGPDVTVPVGDIWFCNASFQGGVCDTTIGAGDTVRWEWVGTAPHTVTECGASCDNPTNSPLFDSPVQTSGTFEHTFGQAGTYLYFCEVHPTLQRGRIIVQGAGATPTPTRTPVPPTPTPRRFGDANKDGTVNSIDAALILQYSAGLISSINPNADVNNDGVTNPIDATLVLQYVAGLINRLPP